MSTAEQDAALLRIVKDRSDARRRRSLLENEIRTAGAALYEIGASLRTFSLNTDRSYMMKQFEVHEEHLPKELTRKVTECFTECDKVQTLDQRAKEQGID